MILLGNVRIIADFNLEKDAKTPWAGGTANIDKSINFAINGNPTNQRINGYIVEIDNVGRGEISGTEGTGKEKYSVANEKIIDYKDKEFEETFDEISFNGQVFKDPTSGEEITIQKGTQKIHIIYTYREP